MKHRAKRPQTRLQFEALESRLPLAGNVTVTFTGGRDLKIVGDNLENKIALSIEDIAGVETLVVAGQDGTTVNNGQIAVPANGFRNLNIDLKKANTEAGDPRGALGADEVAIEGLVLSGNLTVKGGGGGVFSLEGSEVRGVSKITFGNGLSALGVGSTIDILDSSLGVSQAPGKAGKNVTITTANNNDRVFIVDTPMGNNVTINVKNGNNTVGILATRLGELESTGEIGGNLSVASGAGQDAVGFLGVVVGKNLKIGAGKGDNFAGAADLVVKGATTVNTGDGDDIVAIGLRDADGFPLPENGFGNILFGNVTVNTGNGNDLVAAHSTQFGGVLNGKAVGGKVNIKLGNGDDTLLETDNSFRLGAFNALRGSKAGAGTDTLGSDLSPIGTFELRFLQFEREVMLPFDEIEIQTHIDNIFVQVADNFRDVLLDYGIDIGNL